MKDRGIRAEEIVRLSGLEGDLMRAQFEHRLRLIDFWKIREGSKILEIGCGQGETTAALAYTVGEYGFVYGVDVAGENYGEPETLGKARERLMSSQLGERINMDFGVNILSDSFNFEDNTFDYIILSHCIWYLSSYEELYKLLFKVRPWGRKLCIAEWNPCITNLSQQPHFMAANIQAICESYHISERFNIRTMFYPHEIDNSVGAAGWDIVDCENIISPDVQDAFWEIDIVKDVYPQKIYTLKNMPPKLKKLLLSQIYQLSSCDTPMAMSVYALIAERI